MNARPTPKTDALRDLYENYQYRATVGDIWELCEFFERERDEAREETIRTREFMDYGFSKAQQELTDMTAQRDRLAAVLQQCREDSVELVTERDRINAIIASVEARQK